MFSTAIILSTQRDEISVYNWELGSVALSLGCVLCFGPIFVSGTCQKGASALVVKKTPFCHIEEVQSIIRDKP